MGFKTRTVGIAWASALLVLAMPAPASAETPEQLDALSDVTTQEQSGILFARTQASHGEWLEAIGTLERVLAIAPKSHEAKRLQALYLCTVDDRLGGAVILSQLKEKNYAKGALDEVFAMCREPAPEPRAGGAEQ